MHEADSIHPTSRLTASRYDRNLLKALGNSTVVISAYWVRIWGASKPVKNKG